MKIETLVREYQSRVSVKTVTVIIYDGDHEVCRGRGQTLDEAQAIANRRAKHYSIRDERIEIRY